MSDFISSVPGVFTALDKLVREAAEAQSPEVSVFPFAIGEYVPGRYITIRDIQGPVYEWEHIGSFTQKETYTIGGDVVVFTGDAPTTRPNVAIEVLAEAFALLQSCVMTPAFSNRTIPILKTQGPTPNLMLPRECKYTGGPGSIKGAAAGWAGVLEWSFHFEALIKPS